MPKVIEKYILEEKIGGGQFGDVFKGYHQETHQLVAIKSIKRETIKGKFYELLENEIKVLKTCDNPHIMKLFSLKKTPNNYYLMTQYCNGGDMLAKVRKQGLLKQQQVIKYFHQILNGFQTLVKHKIMHRDFKLANILLHENDIKIADFGFAKLLVEDETTTMLGSPLNMAPQVLGGNKYNNKADIWSIGACIYEMLFGKPPFVASNMVDLAKLIKAKPISFPKEIKICETLKDVLKKMMVPEVKRRISWNDLFNHPINTYFDKIRRKEVDLQLVEDESLMINTSKYYLKNNLIINRPEDIHEKSNVNDYIVDIIKNGKKNEAEEQDEKVQAKEKIEKNESGMNYSKVNRRNSKKFLHFRNIYAFLATLADQILNKTNSFPNNEVAAYVLVQKILDFINWLKAATTSEQCPLEGIENWKHYKNQHEFSQIKNYIQNEYEVFKVFNQSIQPIIKKKCLEGQYEADLKEIIMGNFSEKTYRKYLMMFIKALAKHTTDETLKNRTILNNIDLWKIVYYGVKVRDCDLEFGRGQTDYNFKYLYERFDGDDYESILLEIEKMLSLPK